MSGRQQDAAAGPSTSQATLVNVHGNQVPLEWLVNRHDPKRYPANIIVSEKEARRTNRDIHWASHRDQLIAAAAAGIHLTAFAFNLAFWGDEGMPPDRYWPLNARSKLGIFPAKTGNFKGATNIRWDILGKVEGVPKP